MNKSVFTLVIALVIGFVAGIFAWVFSAPLQDFFASFTQEKSAQIEQKPVLKGVPRQVSYIGRIREAERLMEHGYHSLATLELSSAIKEKPDLMKPYLLLGEIYLRTRTFSKLDGLMSALSRAFPQTPEIHIFQVRKRIAQKQFSESMEYIEALGDKVVPALRFYQAVMAGFQNDHERARTILRELSQIPVQEHEVRISSEGLENDWQESRTSLSPAFAAKVRSLMGVYNQFEILADGKNPHLFALISKALSQHRESVLALEAAEISVKEDVSYPDGWMLRGYALFLLRDFHAALADLRHAYELDPLRPETHYFLALTLHELGKNQEAILFFEKSLENDFSFSHEVKWKLVDLFTQQKKYDQVVTLYRELLEEEPNLQKESVVTLVHRAINTLQDPNFALEVTQQLLTEHPSDSFYLNMYGWALIANKRFLEAGQVLSRAQSLEPDNPRTYLNLGLLAEEQSQFSLAEEHYKKSYALGKDGDYHSVVNLAADRYNELVSRRERPEEPEAPDRPESSP